MVEASGLEPEGWEFEPPRCYWIFRHCSPIGRGGWFKPGMLRVRVSPVSFYNGPVSGLALAPAQTVTEFDSPQVQLLLRERGVMRKHVYDVDRIFTVEDFPSPEECQQLIAESEELKYTDSPITTGPISPFGHRSDHSGEPRWPLADRQASRSSCLPLSGASAFRSTATWA